MKLIPIVILIYFLTVVGATQWCEKDIYETALYSVTEELDALAIWFPVRAGSHNAIQLCSNLTGLPIERHCSYNRDATNATWEAIDKRTKFLNCSVIHNNCRAVPFEHYYIMKNKEKKKATNKWQPGRVGELAMTQEPCLLPSGLPLTQKCIYNAKHYMAEWETKELKDSKCLYDVNQEIVTHDLNTLYQEVRGNSVMNANESLTITTRLTNLLVTAKAVRMPADLEISTNILAKLTLHDKDPKLLPKVLEITNLLMECDDNVVHISNRLGTPSTLVKTVETYLDGMANTLVPTSKCNVVPDGVHYYSENLTSVFYMNPFCSGVAGIALYSTSTHPTHSMFYDAPTNSYFRYLYLNQSLDELLQEPHLQVATYLPATLWDTLLKETAGRTNVEAVRMTLYRNKNFFVEQLSDGKEPDSVVLTISIPGYKGDLPADVPLVLRRYQTNGKESPTCGYWNYHTWDSTGVTTSNTELDHRNLILCKTAHLTPFAAVLGVKFKPLEITNWVVLTIMNESTLDVVSIVGCGLSLFGLMCIWATAICCRQWRVQSSNKLLLNMCLVLTLIMAYFLVINMSKVRDAIFDMKNPRHCIAMGAFLQYTILVLFLWMLFVAVLQYQRYVTVIGVERPKHFIAKYALAAWGLPVIPTAMVVYLDPKSYLPSSEDSNALCLPSGPSLYFAVMLPICVIIVANVGIFIYILGSIRRSINKFQRAQERKDIVVQVRLSILLFFLLGISWLFGIVAYMDDSVVFSFLFCVTSTLQGFILFIYFVVIDKTVRLSWLKFCCAMDYFAPDDTIMSPLTTFNSKEVTEL